MTITVSTFIISQRVEQKITALGLSVRSCCNRFNDEYKEDIEAKRIKPLKKDFVQRVRRNKFSTTSDRVLKLCDFLNVVLDDKRLNEQEISDEAKIVDRLILERPDLKPQLNKLITSIAELSQGI